MLTNHLREGQKVLELGLWDGFLHRRSANTKAEVTAIDIHLIYSQSPEQRFCKQRHIRFRNAYALELWRGKR